VGSSIALEAFTRLYRIANEIAVTHETEVRTASFIDFLQRERASPLLESLTQHALELRRQLADRLQKLERVWKYEEKSFMNTMITHSFSCYDVVSVLQEMKNVWNNLKSTEGKLAAISKVCSCLRMKQSESWYNKSVIILTLHAHYRAIEAKLLKQRETLNLLYNRLNKLYEYEIIRKPECIEYAKLALR